MASGRNEGERERERRREIERESATNVYPLVNMEFHSAHTCGIATLVSLTH